MNRLEIINKEYMRRELVQKRLNQETTQQDMSELHKLDRELSGFDVVGAMFDEIAELHEDRERLEWLMRNRRVYQDEEGFWIVGVNPTFGKTPRAAIDAAMAQEAK